MIKPSDQKPEAPHPNNWPIEDYNAFTALVEAAEAGREEHIIDRVTIAARDLFGIAPDHWLVHDVLASVHGKFAMGGGRYAETPKAFLRHGNVRDLSNRELVDWARKLAGMSLH